MSAAAATQQLLQLLSNLPADSNPYTTIRTYLKLQIFAPLPPAFPVILYVTSGALGITGILILVSLAIRIKKRVFWIVRLNSSKLLHPHATCSWSVAAVLLIAILEALIVNVLRYYRQELRREFGYWLLFSYGAGWSAGHVASWSLLASLVVHLQSTRADFPARTATLVSNVYGLVSPVVYLAVLVPLAVRGGQYYQQAIVSFAVIDETLIKAENSWTPGTAFNILSLAPALPLVAGLQEDVNQFVVFCRGVYTFFAITAASLVIILISVAWVYLSSLRRMLKANARQLNHPSFDPRAQTQVPRRRNVQEERVRATLRSLMLTITAFAVLGVVFTSISVLAAVDPLALITSAIRSLIVFLAPLVAFAAGGLLLGVILIIRSRDVSESEQSTNKSSGSHKKSLSRNANKHSTQFSVQLAPLGGLASVGSTPLDEKSNVAWFDLTSADGSSAAQQGSRGSSNSGPTPPTARVHVVVESFLHIEEGDGEEDESRVYGNVHR